MARRIVIDWDDYAARTWWKWSGHTARYPGRRRAWFAVLREWVRDAVHAVARIVLRGDDPQTVPPLPIRLFANTPVFAAPAALALPHVMRGAASILAPPHGRRTHVGRLTL